MNNQQVNVASIEPPEGHEQTFIDRNGVEHKYRMLQYLGAMDSLKHVPKIIHCSTEPIGHATDAVTGYGEPDYTSLGRAISMIANRVEEVGGGEWLRELFKHVSRSSPPKQGEVTAGDGLVWNRVYDQFDTIYAGNLNELYGAIGWVIKVQYDPFGNGALGEWSSQIKELLSALQTALIGEMDRIFGDDSSTNTEEATAPTKESGP